MKTLHLDLKFISENSVELRYFFDNPNCYERRLLLRQDIADLIELVEQDYYVRLAVDYAITGQRLYRWLDGNERWLARALNQYPGDGIILAIAAAEKLAHFPWEILHDGNRFLVERLPAIVPVRWVISDGSRKLSIETNSPNRALQVLFMASSPSGVEPILDFEAEEGRILEATARHRLALTVEESGCLSELGYLVNVYGKDYFDVLHLTGHATLSNGEPRFITETETGEAYFTSAADLGRELQFRFPSLLFLSGCRTGQAANSGVVPSMAEELLKAGAKAVLSWGQTVLDTEATTATAALYQALSAGRQIAEAIALTYQALIQNKARDWHLLRLYAIGLFPGALVTPLRTPGRKSAPPPSVATQFLDTTGRVKVPTRESFVGRRRQLQNCLRVLTQSPDQVGVLIYGMGGLGKSSLAARLCERLPNFEPVVWLGHIDESSLVSGLAEKVVDSRELRQLLQDPGEELRFRLRRVFRQLEELSAKPLLLVLDDFEINLEARDGGYVLQPEAVTVLEALVWAIRETYASHRLILTCRYDFSSLQLQYFYKQPLSAFQGADLQKKCARLIAFNADFEVDKALQLQAQRLADGNPRLLEWLDKILQNSTVDRSSILNRLEADPVELQKQVLAETLLEQIDQPMREMLQCGLVFELPVPKEALAAVCATFSNLEQQINRALALGLLEVNNDQSLRVPRILALALIKETNLLYKNAANVLYRLWWQKAEVLTEEQKIEIYRLALLGKEEEIAVEIGSYLAKFWNKKFHYQKTVLVCKDILKLVRNHQIMYYLAKAEEGLGNTSEAVDCYTQALQLCPPEDEKTCLEILQGGISLYARKGPLEKDVLDEYIRVYFGALQLQQENSGIRTEVAELFSLTMTFELHAGIALQQNQIETAKVLYECCLDFYDKVCDIPTKIKMGEYSSVDGLCGSKARILCHLGTINLNQGKTNEGRKLYLQAAQLFEYAGDDHNRAVTLAAIGTGWLRQGNTVTALNYLHEASAIMQRLAIPELERVNKLIAEAQSE